MRYLGYHTRRFLSLIIAVVIAGLALGLLVTLILGSNACSRSGFVPQGVDAENGEESRAYLAFPEWYASSLSREYANFTRAHKPSEFPFFTTIGQYWCSYEALARLARRAEYPVLWGAHLRLLILGASVTLTYEVSYFYESILGRLAEWSPAPVRRVERQIVSTAQWMTRAIPGVFVGKKGSVLSAAPLSLIATSISEKSLALIPEATIAERLPDGSFRLTLAPGDPTLILALLAARGAEFTSIEGRANIALSVVVPAEWEQYFPEASEILSLPTLTDRAKRRVLFSAAARDLAVTLTNFSAQGIAVEHIYAY